VVVMVEDVPLFDGRLFTRVSSLQELALRMMHRSIIHYREHLRVINMISDSLEQKINASMENRYLLNLFTLEKSLVFYLDSLHSNGVLIEKLKLNAARSAAWRQPRAVGGPPDREQPVLQAGRDVLQHPGQPDGRPVSIVSNNLNVLMKTLNLITIGIMVPTLVVSIFSMNLLLPIPTTRPGPSGLSWRWASSRSWRSCGSGAATADHLTGC